MAIPLLVVLTGNFDNELTRLSLWLSGRCSSQKLRVSSIHFAKHNNRSIRKEAVRALRRKQDWATLARIALTDPDPLIRNLAAGPPRRLFTDKMAWFLRGRSPSSPALLRRQVVFTEDYQPGSGLRPKPVSLIRRLLERIRETVRGKS